MGLLISTSLDRDPSIRNSVVVNPSETNIVIIESDILAIGASFTGETVRINVSLSVSVPIPSSATVTVISALPF